MLINPYPTETEWSVTNCHSLWAKSTKTPDFSTGPLARPFARSLAPLTRSLAPHNSLRSRAVRRLFIRSLAHFAHSLARGTVNDWMAILSVFFSISNHRATVHLLPAYVSFVAFVRGLCVFLQPLVSVSAFPAAHFPFPSMCFRCSPCAFLCEKEREEKNQSWDF